MLKGCIEKCRLSAKNNILLDAGDDFQGSPVCTLTKGKSQIELLNLIHPDLATLGNHEFDYGAGRLRSYLPLMGFRQVSANLWDKSSNATFAPCCDTLVRDGLVIGVVGLAPKQFLSLTLPDNAKTIRMLNTDSVTRSAIASLKSQYHAKLIVVLSHLGVDDDSLLAANVPGIDIIVGGHSHTALFSPRKINGTLIVQAGDRGRWLGRLDLRIDRADGKILSSRDTLIETREGSATPDAAVAAKVKELELLVDERFKEIIGTLTTDWVRTHGRAESNIGDWQADAIREFAHTDVAFQNSGGIRKDLLAGPVTVRDIWEISPFDDFICAFTVTGEELKSMLFHQARDTREFCQVSGLRYTFKAPPQGNSMLDVTVNGLTVDSKKTYTVSVNSFTAGHLEDTFGPAVKSVSFHMVDYVRQCRDIFIEAVKKQKTISSAPDGRILILE